MKTVKIQTTSQANQAVTKQEHCTLEGHNAEILDFHFSSPQSAEKFITDVKGNNQIRSRSKFLLSIGQKLALRKLRRSILRPNEGPLNSTAFWLVLVSGLLVSSLFFIFGSFPTFGQNLYSVAFGVLILTVSGALLALGLPTTPESAKRITHLRVKCDKAISGEIKIIAEQYCSAS